MYGSLQQIFTRVEQIIPRTPINTVERAKMTPDLHSASEGYANVWLITALALPNVKRSGRRSEGQGGAIKATTVGTSNVGSRQ